MNGFWIKTKLRWSRVEVRHSDSRKKEPKRTSKESQLSGSKRFAGRITMGELLLTYNNRGALSHTMESPRLSQGPLAQ